MLAPMQSRQSISEDSIRPMLEKTCLASHDERLSMYSLTTPSTITNNSLDIDRSSMEKQAAPTSISEYHSTLHRLDTKPLQDQRYALSPQKDDHLSLLAFDAKVQRALGKRYTDQDAAFTTKDNTDHRMAVVLDRALSRRFDSQDAVRRPKASGAKKLGIAKAVAAKA